VKLAVNTDIENDTILYLLVLQIDGQEVYKIGITSRTIEERVCEILTSHFGIYRHFPYCRPKRFRKVANAYEHEQELLKHFSEYKFTPCCKFSGSTELISGVDLDVVVQAFENIYKGKEITDGCEDNK
jgi:hypothetical protein